MSQYTLFGRNPSHLVMVGWDNPLQPFFGQVDPAESMDGDEPITLAHFGLDPRQSRIDNVETLAAMLSPRVELPEHYKERLRQDHAASISPTPSQKVFSLLLSERKQGGEDD